MQGIKWLIKEEEYLTFLECCFIPIFDTWARYVNECDDLANSGGGAIDFPQMLIMLDRK